MGNQRKPQDTCVVSPSQCEVPEFCTLDGFANVVERNGGMDITSLDPLTKLAVETDSALFEITLINPAESEILIRGGALFPRPFEAKLGGASFGGSFLKSRWIGIDMRMELVCPDGTFVTLPVRSIKIVEQPDLLGPF